MTDYSATENKEGNNNLLDSEAILLNQYEYASTGQRFLNFFIDNLLMRYALSYASGYAIGALIGAVYPEFFDGFTERSFSYWVLAYFIGTLDYLCYYVLCEKLFNGCTLGKLITGTRAIREDGEPLTLKNALIRTLIRLIPFEVFSGFKIRPWHDEWSHTMVVKAR